MPTIAAVDYDYESHRNVRTKVQSSYGSTSLARFDYVTDSVGRRQTRENSGTMFSATSFNDFDYNDRGEVTQSSRFTGTVQNHSQTKTTPNKDYAYDFDPIGNRKTSNVGNSATHRTLRLLWAGPRLSRSPGRCVFAAGCGV